MFKSDLSKLVFSALGALFFSTTLVSAAVGPAHMAEVAPVGYAAAAPQLGGGVNG